MLGKIPMEENRSNMVIFSHHQWIQLLCLHLQLQNLNFHSIRSEILSVLHLVSMLFDFVTALRAHTMSQRTHPACEMNQDLLHVMDCQSMSTSQIVLWWRCPVKNSRLERMTRIPIFKVFQINLPKKILLLNHSRPNPLSHDCHIHEDESLLNSVRETCARDRQRRVFPLFPLVKLLWHSVRIAWNLLVCRINKWKKVGIEVSFPVTAEILENPEDDWLAIASSRARARARVEVNIKKLSADERAQFRAAQHKEMDQWTSNDVISVCQRAGIPKVRVMTMLWVHTWKVRTQEKRRQKPDSL